jgi:cyanosortase A-associated protein
MTQSTNPPRRFTNRHILLAGTTIALLITVLKLIADPKAANRQPSNFSFPQSVEIPSMKSQGWQLKSSKAIARDNPKTDEFFLNIFEYQYQQAQTSQLQPFNKPLNIIMYYSVSTRGESSSFLAKRFEIMTFPTPLQVKGTSETGYYSLFSYKGRSHLVSCINPMGNTTATSERFLANRNRYDLQLQRFVPWLMGQESLRDMRCLWVEMSIPAEPILAYPILEKAWGSWEGYWQNKFPAY